MLEIYYAKTSQIEKYFDNAYKYLSAERYEKFNRYKNIDDKLRCLASGILLAKFFSAEKINSIEYNKLGKPFIKGDKYFNISHSGEYVVLAISDDVVGIDIENHNRAYDESTSERLQKKIMSVNEQKYMMSSENKVEDFVKFWTLKESYLKWTGEGIRTQLSKIEFVINKDKATLAKGSDEFNFYINSKIKGYTVSICTKDKNFENKITQIEI